MTTWNELIEGKKISLIGPANYLDKVNSKLKLENLNKINESDTIVRLNCTFNIRKKYSYILGERTDIMYNSLLDNCNNGGVINAEEIISAGVKHIRTTPQSSIQGIATSNNKNLNQQTINKLKLLNEKLISLSIMDYRDFTAISRLVNCRPTTGFAAIFDILNHNPSSLHVTGFNFFLSPPLKDYWGGKNKGGIEEIFGRTEEEEALRGFNSKRHVHKNMWKLLKENANNFNNLTLDYVLKNILLFEKYDKTLYNQFIEKLNS